MAPGGSIAGKSLVAIRHCLSHFLQVLPPEPSVEVVNLLASLHITPRHIRQLYAIFRELKQHDPLTLSTGPNEASTASMAHLVRMRRKWVVKILRCLVELGGFQSTITWDGFLYVFLQFCTLSKLELAQVMFFIIARSMKSWTVHYVTTSQLEEFYSEYANCPIMSFNTGCITFTKLPLAKYRMVDFIHLTYRFSQLINPCVHLQRSLQQALPSLGFWQDYDRIKVQNRMLTLDFFRNSKLCSIIDVIADARDGGDLFAAKMKAEREAKIVALMLAEGGGRDDNKPLVVRRHPELSADLPLPTVAQPLPRTRMVVPLPLPSWLTLFNGSNADPVNGTAVGSAAEKPEAWGAERKVAPDGIPPPTSIEAAKALVHATYAPGREKRLLGNLGMQPPSMAPTMGSDDIIRSQELEFIRKARDVVGKRDSMAKVMYRTAPCELIDRPAKKVQGHV